MGGDVENPALGLFGSGCVFGFVGKGGEEGGEPSSSAASSANMSSTGGDFIASDIVLCAMYEGY